MLQRAERKAQVYALLEKVKLPINYFNRYPKKTEWLTKTKSGDCKSTGAKLKPDYFR